MGIISTILKLFPLQKTKTSEVLESVSLYTTIRHRIIIRKPINKERKPFIHNTSNATIVICSPLSLRFSVGMRYLPLYFSM